jgi:hypothetical protein
MKTKLSAKDKVLARNKDLMTKEENGVFKVLLVTKSGVHCIGSGNSEMSAFQQAMKFYNLS